MFNLDKFKLDVSKLKYKFNLDYMNFNSTEDIEPEREIIGQERAVQALKFGLSMKRKGYNIYASGCSGTGRNSYTNMLINEVKGSSKNIKDWVYVYNFKNQNEPISLSFNCGNGKCFKNDIEDIVEKLKDEVPKIFSTKEYEYHTRLLMTELESNIQQIIDELNKVAMVKVFFYRFFKSYYFSIFSILKPNNLRSYKGRRNNEYNRINYGSFFRYHK